MRKIELYIDVKLANEYDDGKHPKFIHIRKKTKKTSPLSRKKIRKDENFEPEI